MNLQEIKKEFSDFVDWYAEDRKTNEDLQSKINKVFDYIATKETELAEGRKEECFEQNNDGTIRPCEVMKENEQLKEDVLEKQDLINDYVMDNAKLEKENAELKIDMEIADSQRQLAEKENEELKEQVEKYNTEKKYYDNLCHNKTVECDDLRKGIKQFQSDNEKFIQKIAELEAQIEKMKNFYNCAHSSSALCPNGHNCKGCKDWGLAE